MRHLQGLLLQNLEKHIAHESALGRQSTKTAQQRHIYAFSARRLSVSHVVISATYVQMTHNHRVS